MFGFSGEHLLILAGVLLIFGPRKLPELGSSIGKAMRNFKEGLNNPNTVDTLEAKEVPQALPKAESGVATQAGVKSPEQAAVKG